MSVDPCASRYYRALVSIALLFLFVVQPAGAQTISIDLAAFGAVTEENPDDPDHPHFILFVGQPAVYEMTITNLGEQEQTISVSMGGGGDAFVLDSIAVVPETAGECVLSEDHTFVDCEALTIPGTGSGKVADGHDRARLRMYQNPQKVGTGGLSGFGGNSETGTPTVGGSVEVREMGETRTLRVFSKPEDVLMLHTRSLEGEVFGRTDFSRMYAEGVAVRVSVRDPIRIGNRERRFYRWEGDFSSTQSEPEIVSASVTMDEDKSVTAQYSTRSIFGFERAISGPAKKQDVVDIYANGILHVDDLQEGMVSPFLDGPSGATFDITDGGAPDNSNPLLSVSFEAGGSAAIILFSETDHAINHDARTEAADSTRADVSLFLPIEQETLESIRVMYRNGSSVTEIFGDAEPLQDNGFTRYTSVSPGTAVIEVLDRNDNTQLAAFQTDLAEGSAVLGLLVDDSADDQPSFSLRLFDAAGQNIETAVVTAAELDLQVPSSFALLANYPNPFNPETVIRFEVPSRTRVTLEVLNPLGQIIETLVDELRTAGTYAETFAAGELPSGTYFYRMTAGSFVETRSMVLMK